MNRHLNCIVEERFELALKEAKETDEFIANTTLSNDELKEQKPFLGVPFTSKESTSSKGNSHLEINNYEAQEKIISLTD